MKRSPYEFWRDEAKLKVLQPREQWKMYVAAVAYIAGGTLATSLLAWFTAPAAAVVSGAVFIAALLAYVVIDLVWHGGEAGARLMAERDELLAASSSPRSDPRNLPLLYLNLRIELKSRLSKFRAEDNVMRNGQTVAHPEAALEELLHRFKADVSSMVAEANQKISALSQDGVLKFSVSEQANRHQFMRDVEKFLTRIDDYRSAVR